MVAPDAPKSAVDLGRDTMDNPVSHHSIPLPIRDKRLAGRGLRFADRQRG